MIIDDDLDVIDALTVLLQPRYCLIACSSAEEARQRLTAVIQIVLLDIKMTGKDGVEAFKMLEEAREDLPIIFHSAYPGSSERATAVARLDHGWYLTKGEYDSTALLTTIERALKPTAEMSAVPLTGGEQG